MKTRWLFVIGVGISLTACVPTTSYYLYNSRADVSDAHNADFQCELAAARAVPTATRIATTPRYTTPVSTSCYDTGYSVQCRTTGGQTYGGNTYSYDANRGLRNEFYAQCMLDRGWRVYELPDCDPEKVPAELKEQLRGKLRKPAEGACYLRFTERAGNIVYAQELLN